MKKIMIVLLLIVMFIPKKGLASEEVLKNAKNGILIEASTKTILFEKNKDEKVAIASLTKMMSQIIILEEIESGNLKWDELVTASANASGMGGTQIWLTTGEKMSVEDLFKGITMASANDATVALAERISGTEANFVTRMNEKAKELGLKNTFFKNSTGLDEEDHYSSAYDLALIAVELLKHEDILKYSQVYEDYIRQDQDEKYWLVNTNKLVRFYEGADGLKTGFTDAAGYCMAVTAKRDGMRLIAIVLGESSGKERNQETTEVLDYGFNLYKVDIIKSKNEIVKTMKLNKATKDTVDIYPKEDVSILSKKSEMSIDYDENIELNEIKYPIKAGDIVGKLQLKYNNKIIKEVDLIIKEDIEKLGFISMFIKNIYDTLLGNFNIG